MSALLLAIDPGAVSGAYAVFFDDGWPLVGDMPVADGQLDAAYFGHMLREMNPRAAVVERVGSMPKQGVASTFKFGMAVGIIHGALLAGCVPMHLVTPSEWKRGMKLSADKEEARALAIRLFPKVEGLHLKKHQGRAEALLLGHYFMLRNGSNDHDI